MPHHTPVHLAAADAVAARAGVAATDLKVEAPPRAELGDLAVGCFQLAKAAGRNPAQLAGELASQVAAHDFVASASAAGPFINIKLDRARTFRWLVTAAQTEQLLPTTIGAGKTICIDYSSPNISKHLAYHHIRGTTLGHALAQIFRALGYEVVGINFLGDWGTTHGMLLAAYNMFGAEEPLDVTKLNELYVKFRAAAKDDPEVEAQGRAYFKRLEEGEPEIRALWQRFRDISWAEFDTIYKMLGIAFDEVRGESAYEGDMARVFDELRPLLTESEGAQVVELEGEKTPILLRTKDGTTLYATRDVAAAQYRWNTHHFTRSLYVVDRGQALHFRQLFKLLQKAGHDWAAQCEHVPYGLIRLGGKKTATRLGGVMLMKDVFKIAEEEVRERIAAVNPNLPAAIVDDVAPKIGIGAVVFANLATQRDKDIDFDLEKATSLDGDSGPYIQYSHARCASILRKANEGVGPDDVDYTLLTHDSEWAVAKKLLELPDVVVRAADNSEPHGVAHYLLALAGEFSRWYTQGNGDASLRVLCDDAPTRRARLALVTAVQAALATGLALLGMAAPEQM